MVLVLVHRAAVAQELLICATKYFLQFVVLRAEVFLKFIQCSFHRNVSAEDRPGTRALLVPVVLNTVPLVDVVTAEFLDPSKIQTGSTVGFRVG